MQTTNKSINYQSDRGNDIYREREVITIKISPSSAPLINTSDSYLTFSLKMTDSRNGATPNGAYVIPDPFIGATGVFEEIQVWTGDQSVLLEQMSSLGLWSAMKNYYGNNANDDQLQSIYEGRGKLQNPMFMDNGAAGVKRAFPTNGATPFATEWASRGGGFGSQYYQVENAAVTADNSRKSQIIYRFPMSGLLSAMRTELLPAVVLNGITLRITLAEGLKFCRYQEILVDDQGATTSTSVGYAEVTAAGVQSFTPQNPVTKDYGASNNIYSIHGYIDTILGEQLVNIPAATNIRGLVLKKAGDGGDGFDMDDIKNLSLKIGSQVGIGINRAAWANGEVTTIPNRITEIKFGAANRIVVQWAANYLTGAAGDAARAGRWADQNNPICCSLANIKAAYEVSDLQMVCNVVEAPPGYIQTMVQQAQSGKLRLQYNSYQDNRINITTGALSNEMFIPCDLQRCMSILAVSENLRGASIYRSDYQPSPANLFNYQWIMDTQNVPNIPVDLQRLAANRVSPLAIIECEKALDESSIRIRNIQNPHNFPVLGRRLGAYGDSVSLLEKILKCRVNYSPSQPDNLMWHFFIYHTKMITFEGGMVVVVE